jgi:hypothetical protein
MQRFSSTSVLLTEHEIIGNEHEIIGHEGKRLRLFVSILQGIGIINDQSCTRNSQFIWAMRRQSYQIRHGCGELRALDC